MPNALHNVQKYRNSLSFKYFISFGNNILHFNVSFGGLPIFYLKTSHFKTYLSKNTYFIIFQLFFIKIQRS